MRRRPDRHVACIYLPHFPLQVESMRHRLLRETDSPVIIAQGGDSAGAGNRTVLDCTHGLEGVLNGMPLAEAASRHPNALLVEADIPHYEQVFEEVLDGLQQCVPVVEADEPGSGRAFVGIWGLERLYGDDAHIVRLLAEAVRSCGDLDVRIGVGENKWVAGLAARKSAPHSARKVASEPGRFVANFPVETLPVPIETMARLRGFGLERLGDIAGLPEGALLSQFGPAGGRIWQLSNGFDDSPLVARELREKITAYMEFPDATVNLSVIVPAIESLLESAFRNPRLHGCFARRAEVTARVFQRAPWTLGVAFREPVGDRNRALFAIKSKLGRIEIPGPLEDMRLTLTELTGESGRQESLWLEIRRHQQLEETLRQLEERIGTPPPVFSVRELEPWSRIPERRHALVRLGS